MAHTTTTIYKCNFCGHEDTKVLRLDPCRCSRYCGEYYCTSCRKPIDGDPAEELRERLEKEQEEREAKAYDRSRRRRERRDKILATWSAPLTTRQLAHIIRIHRGAQYDPEEHRSCLICKLINHIDSKT